MDRLGAILQSRMIPWSDVPSAILEGRNVLVFVGSADLKEVYQSLRSVSADVGLPFRAPHHSISVAGLAGPTGMPPEVELAGGGLLVLDEVTEYKPSKLEALFENIRDPRPLSIVGLVRHDRDEVFMAPSVPPDRVIEAFVKLADPLVALAPQ